MTDYWDERNWFTDAEIKKQFDFIRNQAVQVGDERSANLRYLLSSIDQLERDIGRGLLKVHAIVDVLIEKGIVTDEELADRATVLDQLDGERDGALNPSVFRTEIERTNTPPPRVFMAQLETGDPLQTTEEFLADLESQSDAPAE